MFQPRAAQFGAPSLLGSTQLNAPSTASLRQTTFAAQPLQAATSGKPAQPNHATIC